MGDISWINQKSNQLVGNLSHIIHIVLFVLLFILTGLALYVKFYRHPLVLQALHSLFDIPAAKLAEVRWRLLKIGRLNNALNVVSVTRDTLDRGIKFLESDIYPQKAKYLASRMGVQCAPWLHSMV